MRARRFDPGSSRATMAEAIIMLFTGWKGWEMVNRHRVGVTDQLR
jgi:hypothetical protein